ncbi:TetR/AcrR family transcriptional regulator [Streptomyces thermodiastaticus]|jgi:AcrR family transcriptional regulator|uniref:TetR/AcrR family transcriptional regulator n=1 Tax=Streptomyces thermodiastaticus TaxID=44061 RepID=UPI001679B40D|nr:TetR/AcrR family transcriptional regulator [Streptomyces thermodiastaticus]MCE7551943.1 TetR/AcrR family transcriptional regulator [Streptomyces thermodiastaticus]GHE24006.1 transcriptional regulator [Streptomyces thermodiastaticus]
MSSSTEERRLTARGRATRDRIVAAAATLMYERGVAGTSTEDILKAARVTSPSQLYHYFGDKRALVQAVVRHQTERVLRFQRPLLSRLDSFEALQAWRDAVVQAQHARDCRGGCPMGSLAAELSDHDPEARAQLVAGYAQWEGAIRDGLRAMQQRGELDADADTGRLALALLTALQGGLVMTQIRRDTTALEAALDTMIDQIRSHATL